MEVKNNKSASDNYIELKLANAIKLDLMRADKWKNDVVSFLAKNYHYFHQLKENSPLILEKNLCWLIDTKVLNISQHIILKYQSGTPLTQGSLIRLLGCNTNNDVFSKQSKKRIEKKHSDHWAHQIRSNIKPIMGDYFSLLEFEMVGEDKSGCRGYNIKPTRLLIKFFEEVLYKE